MNKFMKVLAAICLGATLTSISFAQGAGPSQGAVTPQAQSGQHGGKGGPAGRMKHMMELQASILKQLNLSADQEAKVKLLDAKTHDALKDLQKDQAGKDRSAMREGMQKIMKEHHKDLLAILSPDQQTKFKALWKEQMEKMRAEHGKGQGKGQPNKP